jgi:pimeloyl-ACP methyl ester carboxylesterase
MTHVTRRFAPPRRPSRSARSSLALPLLLAALSTPALSATPAPDGPVLSPCGPEWPSGAECGRVRVPENRAAPAGRTLDLFVVRLPALGSPKAPEPVFLLAGGPGDAASETANDLPGVLGVLRPRRDLVFVDQRGTGRSQPLSCAGRGPGNRVELGEPSPAEARACRAALERQADLRRYTTEDAVEDLEAVRQALGYGAIDLLAASYGTQVAQSYLRRHPDRLRAAVLLGTLPPAPESLLFDPLAAERSLHLLLQDCAAEPACATAFPRLPEETATVLRRLAEHSVRVTVDDSHGGGPREVTLDRRTFAGTLRTRLYSAEAASRVPLALHQAFAGDYRSMARATLAIARAVHRGASLGAFLAVACSEWTPFLDAAAVERLAAGTFFGPGRTLGWMRACREWPRAALPVDFAAPVRAEVPVLLLSGRLDPVAPPAWAEQVAIFLPHARQVVFAASSHFPDGACASGLAERFFEQGSAAGLDARCAETETRPPFVVREP